MVKIMVVEDERVILKMLAATLRSFERAPGEETEVFPFSDPIAAAVDYANIQPDLILLDQMMPGLTGLEFLDAIQWDKGKSTTKVIMYSAYGDQEPLKSQIEDRVTLRLVKPISPSKLLSELEDILAGGS